MKTPIESARVGALAALLYLAVGCGGTNGAPAPEQPAPAEPAPSEPTPATGGGGAGLANPASVNCVERGGKLEMVEGPGGTSGVCLFDDGSRCEEWRFFRGQCAPGECREQAGVCD